MGQETRNHALPGVAVLLGAALAAFGATQGWANLGASVPLGPLAGLAAGGSVGFDLFVAPDGQGGDVRPMLLAGAALLAVSAFLLFATRIPGPGVAWRLLALLATAFLGFMAAMAWSTLNNPSSVVADPGSGSGRGIDAVVGLLDTMGVVEVRPGLGLWLLTIGTGLAGIGALIPAGRGPSPAVQPPPVRGPAPVVLTAAPAGWYPDQLDARFVRFFDGVRWTDAVRPRG